MQLVNTYRFEAPADRVWALLMDTGALARCVPGCQGLEPNGENRYRARLAVPVAAITGQYDAIITLQDVVPPSSYTLVVEGQGRPGFVKGTSRIALQEQDGGTQVTVSADVQVGGAIARVGQRLLEGVGRTMMDRFFACLGQQLS